MQIPENYQLFKFKNGEDVIAEVFVSPEDKNHLILRRPMQIQVMMRLDKNRNPVPAKLIMTEWLAFSQGDSVVVPRNNILCYSKPTEMIVGVYDNEKKRIDKMRANSDTETPPPNELDKTDEELTEQKKVQKQKDKKRRKMIFMQMSLETMMRFLEGLGLDIEEEPWKTMVNPPDSDDDDEFEDDDDDEEEKPENIDGRMDIMPDVDGDGWVDPFGNPWSGPEPK